MPDITQKYLNDRRAKLKGELQALSNKFRQLQQAIQQTSAQMLAKQGELQAIEEVQLELQRKETEKGR